VEGSPHCVKTLCISTTSLRKCLMMIYGWAYATVISKANVILLEMSL